MAIRVGSLYHIDIGFVKKYKALALIRLLGKGDNLLPKRAQNLLAGVLTPPAAYADTCRSKSEDGRRMRVLKAPLVETLKTRPIS